MVNLLSTDDFVDSLNVSVPDISEFFKLKKNVSSFTESPTLPLSHTYEMGRVFYGLISKYKPKNILEIGTSTGFSTLCMAKAAADLDLDTTIYTIEPDSLEKKLKFSDEKNVIHHISIKDNWKRFAPASWISKIKTISGYSTDILKTYDFPKIQFAYVEGSQHFHAAQADFYSLLKHLDVDFRLLFSWYVSNEKEHITQFIDEEIIPNFTVDLIETTSWKQYMNQKISHDTFRAGCFIDSSTLKNTISKLFPSDKVTKTLNQYEKFLKRWKIRRMVNKKLPFFNKIKFSS